MTEIPTEPGDYLVIVNGELDAWVFGHQTGWYEPRGDEGNVDPSVATHFIRVESAIDLACKIAFAEMWEADLNGMGTAKQYDDAAMLMDRYGLGERTHELLADMLRVTRELRGGK